MQKFLTFENDAFNSLDECMEQVFSLYMNQVESSANSDSTDLTKSLIKLKEGDSYSMFFLFSQPLLNLLQSVESLEALLSLKEEGFFILTPVKTNIAVGKGYEISYCKNGAKLISKNLTNYGYVFITETKTLARVEDGLLLCHIEAPSVYLGTKGSKRLVELFPGLYTFFNSRADHQALIINSEEN